MQRRNLKVLIHEASDIPGQWVAHCLNLDVISQGNSPAEARDNVEEAILIVLNDDLANGWDPFDRDGAPQKYWDAYAELERIGKGVDISNDDVAEKENVTRFGVVLSFDIALSEPAQPQAPAEQDRASSLHAPMFQFGANIESPRKSAAG